MDFMENVFIKDESCSLDNFLNRLHRLFSEKPIQIIDSVSLGLIDLDLIEEIRSLPENVSLLFGRNQRELKCIIIDEDSQRHHEIFLKYNGPEKINVSCVNLPYSELQECEFSSIEEVVHAFQQYINSLNAYFHELECIDETFTVMEPVKPTFKDGYRRISLDERTWLHIEVTTDGSASNIHLVGQSELFNEKLQTGLLAWDHDKDIVENIMVIFELMKTSPVMKQINMSTEEVNNKEVEVPSCAICFCVELPDIPGVPQPLCQNLNCGVYFHKSCLYQWLVACEGGRLPAFGVAHGSCPTCLQPITCSEKDN